MIELLLNHLILTGVAILLIIGAIWLFFEVKNAPEMDDWD